MSKDAATPRVFLIRHGETEWSRSGKFTGRSDIPLLTEGETRFRSTINATLGEGRLIQPSKLVQIFCSPRQRATRTLELLLEKVIDESLRHELNAKVVRTEDVAEWSYGDYEGLLTKDIRALRKQRGLDQDREWDIWRDGTEGVGSEGPTEVSKRVDRIITQITEIQGKGMREGDQCSDVIIVAHGHILRAFVKRWLGLPLDAHIEMMLEPGGICGLSYAHGNVKERAVLVGMSFPGN